MSVKITTLIENMPDQEGKLCYEHGFSAFIEFDGKKLLFDTGQTGAFVENAKALGIDLSQIDVVVLSHGHYDHTGGVPALLTQLKKKTPLYIGKEFFASKYKQLEDGTYKYNGNPFSKNLVMGEDSLLDVHFVEQDVTWLTERIVLLKNFARVSEFEKINPKFFLKKEKKSALREAETESGKSLSQETESQYEQDLFLDEIVLGLLTEKGLVLIAGCSHVGIVNILEHTKQKMEIPVVAVLGGTHLVEAEEERLLKTVQAFREHGVQTVAVSHCTGEMGMQLLQKEFATGFLLNNTGKVFK